MSKKKSEYDGNSICLGIFIGGIVVYLVSTAMYIGRLNTYIDNPPLTRDSCIKYIQSHLD